VLRQYPLSWAVLADSRQCRSRNAYTEDAFARSQPSRASICDWDRAETQTDFGTLFAARAVLTGGTHRCAVAMREYLESMSFSDHREFVFFLRGRQARWPAILSMACAWPPAGAIKRRRMAAGPGGCVGRPKHNGGLPWALGGSAKKGSECSPLMFRAFWDRKYIFAPTRGDGGQPAGIQITCPGEQDGSPGRRPLASSCGFSIGRSRRRQTPSSIQSARRSAKGRATR